MSKFTDNQGQVWHRRSTNVVVVCTTAEGPREFTDIGGQVCVRIRHGQWSPVGWCRFTNRVRIALEALS
jgi:hypothetical protein